MSLSIPLSSSLIFQHLIPPNLAFVSLTWRKLFPRCNSVLKRRSTSLFFPIMPHCFIQQSSKKAFDKPLITEISLNVGMFFSPYSRNDWVLWSVSASEHHRMVTVTQAARTSPPLWTDWHFVQTTIVWNLCSLFASRLHETIISVNRHVQIYVHINVDSVVAAQSVGTCLGWPVQVRYGPKY